jgi:hypothetical protein
MAVVQGSAILAPSMRLVVTLVVLLIAIPSAAAEAGCRRVLDCTVRPCQPVDECDSALDDSGTGLGVRAPAPPQRPAPPKLMVPESLPLIPPRDTGFCRRAYVCDAGRCAWQVICQ